MYINLCLPLCHHIFFVFFHVFISLASKRYHLSKQKHPSSYPHVVCKNQFQSCCKEWHTQKQGIFIYAGSILLALNSFSALFAMIKIAISILSFPQYQRSIKGIETFHNFANIYCENIIYIYIWNMSNIYMHLILCMIWEPFKGVR